MTYGSVAADQIQNTTGYTLGAGNATNFKNRIINGAMVIDQRNAGASVATTDTTQNIYTLDRWYYRNLVASKYTIQQNAGSVTPPVGFTNYLGCTSTSAYTVGASEFFSVSQNIEGYNIADLGWGTANAKTVTLSFQVYSSLTGTFGGVVANYIFSRCYPFTFTVSSANTWTSVSITIAGDTSGTWLTTNSIGLIVRFSLGSGSTYSGTAGAWSSTTYTSATGATSVVGTNGATFYITGVQLEVGSYATGFEYRDIGRELILCQRYFYNVGGDQVYAQATTPSTASSTSSAWASVFFPVTMRTTPSFSYSALSDWNITQNISGLSISALSIYSLGSSSKQAALNATASPASLIASNTYYYSANGSTNARLNFSAEL
jgi:hypothetical protein